MIRSLSTPVANVAVTRPQASRDASKAAHDFESMALDQFLQPMFSTLDDSGGLFGGGAAESTLKPLLITEYAKLMEQRGGLGLEKPIEQKMAQMQAQVDHK